MFFRSVYKVAIFFGRYPQLGQHFLAPLQGNSNTNVIKPLCPSVSYYSGMPNNHLDISLVPLLLEIVLPRKEGRILFLMNMLQNKNTLPRGICTLAFHLQRGLLLSSGYGKRDKVWNKKRAHVQKLAISKKSTFFALSS